MEFRVVYAIPEEARESFAREGIPESDTWTLSKPVADRRTAWAQRLLHGAHARRHPTPSDELFAWRRREDRGVRRFARERFFRGMARVAGGDRSFASLRRLEERSFARTIPERVWEFLRETKPVGGLSTSCVLDWERPLFQAMSMSGIPTATHVLSFDNLTSRGYLPLGHFSKFFVWQAAMAAELERFYGVGPESVTVTGTPQFDFHVRPEFRWSRAKTVAALALPSDRPYFVYCANHFGITPSEPALVADLLASVGRDARFEHHQWVVRLHPMDEYGRWASLEAQFPQLVVSRPWKHESVSRFWAIPSSEEVALLGNTLRHADATLTVASTTALDSAVVDTPVVCVGFHPSAEPWEDRFYRDAHYSQHYRPLMESGATPMADGMDTLRELLAAAVRDREALKTERAELVRRLCGAVDGGAAERIARGITALVSRGAGDIADRQPRAGVGTA